MIQFALHESSYLDAAKYFYKVWETPTIKEEVTGRGREVRNLRLLRLAATHLDTPRHLSISCTTSFLRRTITSSLICSTVSSSTPPSRGWNSTSKCGHSEHQTCHTEHVTSALVKCFTTPELMRWPGIEQIYGPHLKQTSVFQSPKLWEDLHTRVIEHVSSLRISICHRWLTRPQNIRIVSQYYTRITLARLTSLLDLTQQQTEEILCRLVVSGTVWARVDRPAGIVNFRKSRSAEDVMNDWSSDMQKLLGLVEKTWMGVNAAQAAQSRAVKAS